MSEKCLEICEDCGKTFLAGPEAFLCPRCRRKRLSEAAKKRNLNKLGNDARWEQRAIAKKMEGKDD